MADATTTTNAVPALGSSLNPDIQVTGPTPAPAAAPTSATTTLSGKTVPMVSPKGNIGDVPQENVQDAVSKGFKVGMSMVSPKGNLGVVPVDRVHDAIAKGFRIDDGTGTSLSSGVTGAASGVANGFAKGAVGTMRGVSNLVGDALGTQNPLNVPDVAPVSGIAEHIGSGGEAVLEFMLGDEALKGLTMGEKLAKVAPLVQTLEKYPRAAKAFGAAVRGGVVGGTQGAVKGGTVGSAVTGAVAGAAGGAAFDVAPDAIGAVPDAAAATKRMIVNPFRKAANALTGTDIQPTLKAGLQDVFANVAKADNVPFNPSQTTSIRDLGEQVGDAIMAKSKAAYKLIDDATDGRFSGVEQELRDAQRALRFVSSDAEEEAARVRVTRLQMQQEQMFDQAAKDGVDRDVVQQAKSDFKKAQAIYDTNGQIAMATKGVRPGMKGSSAVPEEVDAKSLMNRLNKMYNSGRLQEAVGDDSAEDLIAHSANAQKAARNVTRNRVVAGVVAPAAASALAGTAYELTK